MEKSREREKLKTLTAAAVHVGGFVEFKREKEKKSSRRFEQRSMEHTSTSHKKLDTVPLIFLLLIYHDNKILGMSEDIKYIHSVQLYICSGYSALFIPVETKNVLCGKI